MKRFLLYGAATLALCSAASAASIEYTISKAGAQWVDINGPITDGDFDRFKAVADKVAGKAVVFLNSTGGNLMTAILIGDYIHARAWPTFAPQLCTSACALIWLAGADRAMFPTSRIGFHAASVEGKEEGAASGNAVMGAYLNKLGLGYGAIIWATSAKPNEMYLLTEAKAKELDINISVLNTDKPKVATATAPAVPVAPVRPYTFKPTLTPAVRPPQQVTAAAPKPLLFNCGGAVPIFFILCPQK